MKNQRLIIKADNSMNAFTGKLFPVLAINQKGIFMIIGQKASGSYEGVCIQPHNADSGILTGHNYTLFQGEDLFYYDGVVTLKNS